MKRKWAGETITWEFRHTDKLKTEWYGCGEHYEFIVKQSPCGWMAFYRTLPNRFQAFAGVETMKEARMACEEKGSSL